MSKRGDILVLGGTAHECDMCEKCDGRPTLYWKKRDFDLCYECIEKVFIQTCGYEKLSHVKVRRAFISEKMREEILKKYDYQCVKCHSKSKLEIDHIIPFSIGGKTDIENLQVLCKSCNLKKGNGKK